MLEAVEVDDDHRDRVELRLPVRRRADRDRTRPLGLGRGQRLAQRAGHRGGLAAGGGQPVLQRRVRRERVGSARQRLLQRQRQPGQPLGVGCGVTQGAGAGRSAGYGTGGRITTACR